MKRLLTIALLPLALAAQSGPSVREAAAAFAAPPAEDGLLDWWGWSGSMTEQTIVRDLDARKANHITGVLIGPGRGLEPRYLTPAYFERVRFAVDAAKRRGMVLWIADEGSYPSGIAGAKFNTERPDLRMQGVVIAERIDAPGGATVSCKLPAETLGALAVNQADKRTVVLDTSSGELNWTAPEGRWLVLLIQHQFRTSPTRYIYHPTGAKDTTHSLFDYLNADATRQFLTFVHEEYKKYIGAEFGRTVRGFFGDEPDYAHVPWTPAILGEFERRKGYDVRPYLVRFFAPVLSEEVKRAKADYWDVWSDLYRDNFIKPQADWCAQNNLQYVVHLNHEDEMMRLVRSQADYFKAMRYVQVPAIDAIWRQNLAEVRPRDAPLRAVRAGEDRGVSGKTGTDTDSATVSSRLSVTANAKLAVCPVFQHRLRFAGRVQERCRIRCRSCSSSSRPYCDGMPFARTYSINSQSDTPASWAARAKESLRSAYWRA